MKSAGRPGACGAFSFAKTGHSQQGTSLRRLRMRGLQKQYQQARPGRCDRCSGRGACSASPCLPPPVGEDRSYRPAAGPEPVRLCQPAAGSAARAASKVQAKAQGRRVGAEEHQERGDAGRGSQAENRNSARPADCCKRHAAAGRSTDAGRIGAYRTRYRRWGERSRDRERQRRQRSRRRRKRSCGSASSRQSGNERARFSERTSRFLAAALDRLPEVAHRCARLRCRMHGRPRHRGCEHRFGDVQPCPRKASFPTRPQPKRRGGCRMVRIRATSAPIRAKGIT